MTLREISEYDCIDGECPLYYKCRENTKVFGMDYCDMARELLKVVEGINVIEGEKDDRNL